MLSAILTFLLVTYNGGAGCVCRYYTKAFNMMHYYVWTMSSWAWFEVLGFLICKCVSSTKSYRCQFLCLFLRDCFHSNLLAVLILWVAQTNAAKNSMILHRVFEQLARLAMRYRESTSYILSFILLWLLQLQTQLTLNCNSTLPWTSYSLILLLHFSTNKSNSSGCYSQSWSCLG